MPDEKAQDELNPESEEQPLEEGQAEPDEKYLALQKQVEELQESLSTAEERYKENDLQWKRTLTQYGEENSRLKRQFEQQQNPKEGPKKRRNFAPVDPLTAPDKFAEWQTNIIEEMDELRTERENLRGQLAKLQDVDQVKQEVQNLRYENFLSKEENDLKTKYRLSDRDLKRIRNMMQDSGIATAKGAAMLIPDIEEKMFRNSRYQQPQREENRNYEKPQQAKQERNPVARDMKRASQESSPLPGSRRADPDRKSRLAEIQARVESPEWYNLAPDERAKMVREIEDAVRAEQSNGSQFRF